MDGQGQDFQGPCAKDTPEACGSSTKFYDFSVETIPGNGHCGEQLTDQPPAEPPTEPAAEPPAEPETDTPHGSRRSSNPRRELSGYLPVAAALLAAIAALAAAALLVQRAARCWGPACPVGGQDARSVATAGLQNSRPSAQGLLLLAADGHPAASLETPQSLEEGAQGTAQV